MENVSFYVETIIVGRDLHCDKLDFFTVIFFPTQKHSCKGFNWNFTACKYYSRT